MKTTVLQIDAQETHHDEKIIKRITEIDDARVETKPLSSSPRCSWECV